MQQTYVHKPTEVEAIQLTSAADLDAVREFIGSEATIEAAGEAFILNTEGEGNRNVNAGDYIIKGVRGVIYPCSAEVFEDSYEVKSA